MSQQPPTGGHALSESNRCSRCGSLGGPTDGDGWTEGAKPHWTAEFAGTGSADYAEIRGTPADPLHAVRAYARGVQAGIARAITEDYAAAAAELDALEACRLADLPLKASHEMLELARAEARAEAPGLDVVQQRVFAAIRVRRLVVSALLARLLELEAT